MKTPHKHAELIKAWADGAEIEFYDTRFNEHRWKLTGPFPYWQPEVEFRIKPEPKPDTKYWLRTYEHSGGSIYTPHFLQPTGTYPANIKLTFDGETGNLKSAEVL